MKKILVTGGCGFIGSHLIRFLLNASTRNFVINLDALTYAGNRKNLRDVEAGFLKRYRFARGKIEDDKFVENVFKKYRPDFVLNLAAESHVDRSILNPRVFLTTNVLGVQNLLDKAVKFKVKKFVQVSTDEVYGVAFGQRKFREKDLLIPRSPYAASKAAGDLLALAFHETYNLPICITRGSNAFGPNQYPEKFMPLAITNLLEGKKIPIYGNGKQSREWTFVKDHVRAICSVLAKGKPGEVYNFGSGQERKNIEIAYKFLELLGKNKGEIAFVKDRPGHDRRYRLDSSKIKRLGWKPEKSFEQGIKETVLWYQQNEKWWKPLKSAKKYQSYSKKNYG